MNESTKKPYMGGEETGYPEMSRTITNKDITNTIAQTLPEYSEFYGENGKPPSPELRKFLQQSEFKKPYGRLNEETPDYPDMEYTFSPPGNPVIPGFPNLPLNPEEAIFDVEFEGKACPGQWTELKASATQLINRLEIMNPDAGELIEKVTKNWKKFRVYVPMASAGQELNIRAIMQSPSGIPGYSNDYVEILSSNGECPRPFMDITLSFSGNEASFSRSFVYDFQNAVIPTDIKISEGGSSLSFPIADHSDLNYFISLMDKVIPVNNWYRSEVAGPVYRTACAPFDVSWGCSPGNGQNTGQPFTYNGGNWQGSFWSYSFVDDGGCNPGVCTADGEITVQNSSSEPIGRNGIWHAGGIQNEFQITDIFNISYNYNSTTRTYPNVGTPPCVCLYDDEIIDTMDVDVAVSHDGHSILSASYSLAQTPLYPMRLGGWPWYYGMDGSVGCPSVQAVQALAIPIPYVSNWNYGKKSPINVDFATDMYLALFQWGSGTIFGYSQPWTRVRGAWAGVSYAPEGANKTTITGIDLTGAEDANLKSMLLDIMDSAIAALSTCGYINAIGVSIQFYYGKY